MNKRNRHPEPGTGAPRASLRALLLIGTPVLPLAFMGQFALSQQPQQIQSTPISASATPASSGQQTGATITLDQAIALARANEPNFASAVTAAKVAGYDRSLAKAALLPGVSYHNQYLYTQPSTLSHVSNPSQTPRFIANNAVHEYISQATISESIGVQQLAAAAHASAVASVASAELEIARRGLVATVVGLYYGELTAEHKVTSADRAATEAASFTKLTQQREDAREGAHADLIKAQLQQQQRQRDLSDAQLAAEKARLDLAVLLFSDPHTPFSLVAAAPTALATRAEIEAAAMQGNPELKSALASLRASNLEVTGARAAYLPDLGLNYFYGIDSAQFATRGPGGSHNLGYSAAVTVDVPVWDWFSTHDRIKQKESLRESAKVALSAAQRKLIAQLNEDYNEAIVAQAQLHSLDLSVDTARESLRLTRLRYTAGESTVLEVVDAQNSLTSAEIAREDGILRYQTALANLQTLTGTM
jgi:outer membrane protein TolC